MRRRFGWAALGLSAFLGANAAAAPALPLSLSCDGPFRKTTSEAELKTLFGPANVSHALIDGPEGETYPATVLFARDPARTVRIVWIDDAARRGVSDVTVVGGAWRGPRDIRVGSTMAEVEKANGRPFTLYGFGWDYGGIVSDWRKGALEAGRPGCAFHARFEPGPVDDARALGDGTFSSADARMRADRPLLAEFGIGFAN